MIAVCLLTSGRAYYTETTLRTFSQHNHGQNFTLLHADDGSADDRNMELAEEHGFETVYRSSSREGGVPALRHMWNEAARQGCDRILHLENDFEWVAPIPMIDWPCVRLYGAMKGRGALHSLACTRNLVTNEPVEWKPHEQGWERAPIHFGGPPSIIGTDMLLKAVASAKVLKDIGLFTVDTLRPVENIVWHIGAVTTRKAPC